MGLGGSLPSVIVWDRRSLLKATGNCNKINSPWCIVDQGVFKESTENEEDADTGPDVDSLGVGDWGETALDGAHGGGHGQQGGHPQGHPRRHRLVVQPEGEPRDEDNHEARDVDGQDVERKLSCDDNVD